jgi:hypothetical protein
MWWPVVFWILLIPLIIVEFIIFLKTKKFTWLVYALAIFTYVIAVTYTIDVFSLNRNIVILVLLISAGLMAWLGRQFSRKPSKTAGVRKTAIIVIAVVMALLFLTSIVFGRMQETVKPVASVKASSITFTYDGRSAEKPYPSQPVTVLTRELRNQFILPVPIVQKQYRMCLRTTTSWQELYANSPYMENEEVGPGQTKTITVQTSPVSVNLQEQPLEILVYENDLGKGYSYASCNDLANVPVLYKIPVV